MWSRVGQEIVRVHLSGAPTLWPQEQAQTANFIGGLDMLGGRCYLHGYEYHRTKISEAFRSSTPQLMTPAAHFGLF